MVQPKIQFPTAYAFWSFRATTPPFNYKSEQNKDGGVNITLLPSKNMQNDINVHDNLATIEKYQGTLLQDEIPAA